MIASKQAKTKKNKTTILGVCAEAARIEGFTDHVEKVEPADVVHGINPMELYKQIASGFETQNVKNKAEGGRARKKDSLLLTAGVFSYPGGVDEDFYSWQVDCIDYLKKEYGKNFKSAVVHIDEANPHIHFFLCDMKELRVDGGLDPAKTDQRKQRVLKDGSAIGQREALKAFQDRFHDAVGVKYAHARKIGSRDRIHGPPRWVRSILAEMKEVEIQKAKLQETKNKNREEAQFLRDKSKEVVLLEKRFLSGLERIEEFFEDQDLKRKTLIRAGKIGEAEAVCKSIHDLRNDLLSNAAIAATIEKRIKKPAWFS